MTLNVVVQSVFTPNLQGCVLHPSEDRKVLPYMLAFPMCSGVASCYDLLSLLS